MSSASRGLAPREGLVRLLMKMGCTRPLEKPRLGPGGYFRRSGNGGPQTSLPPVRGVAPPVAWYGPSSPANTQDPREGPSLARQMAQDLLRGGLTRLAREERRDQGEGHLVRFP